MSEEKQIDICGSCNRNFTLEAITDKGICGGCRAKEFGKIENYTLEVKDENFKQMLIEPGKMIEANGSFIVENRYAWFYCPCGCGDLVTLRVFKKDDPHPEGEAWILEDINGTPNLSPSVNTLDGCKSHYYIRNGKVEWC